MQPDAPELLYGRNMWDIALNAYTYDVCPVEVKELYQWMEAFSADEAPEDEVEFAKVSGDMTEEIREKAQKAFSLGVNSILLPKKQGVILPGTSEWAEIIELEQYYLLIARADNAA